MPHMDDASSLVPLYMISSNIYCGDHVMQYQHILWWPVHGPLVTSVNYKSAALQKFFSGRLLDDNE